MGEITGGVRSAYSLNPENPASYSALTYTTLEVGAALDLNTITTQDSSYKGAYGTINHLAVGFPIKRGKCGLALGLTPFATTNYSFVDQHADTSRVYSGKGSLYNLFIGTAYKIGDVSIGVNLGYLFGGTTYSKGYSFADSLNAFDVSNSLKMRVSGLLYDVGVQYNKRIAKRTDENHYKSDIFLTLGAYGHSESPAATRTSSYWARYITVNGVSVPVDTPSSTNERKGKLTLPWKVGGGFTVGNENWWILGADFKYTKWSVYSSDLNNGTLTDSWRFSFGAGITPDYLGQFIKRINYKAGFYMDQSEVFVNGSPMKEIGGTFGITLPFMFSRERSATNDMLQIYLMGDIGKRTPQNTALISETYYRITVGFAFNAVWFQKRKFD